MFRPILARALYSAGLLRSYMLLSSRRYLACMVSNSVYISCLAYSCFLLALARLIACFYILSNIFTFLSCFLLKFGSNWTSCYCTVCWFGRTL